MRAAIFQLPQPNRLAGLSPVAARLASCPPLAVEFQVQAAA
jgi:hypothetical protein